jgi:nucleoid DNA-binding protein
VGTFKAEHRPARRCVNPRTGKLFFTPEQVRLTFELSRRLSRAGKPKASELR